MHELLIFWMNLYMYPVNPLSILAPSTILNECCQRYVYILIARGSDTTGDSDYCVVHCNRDEMCSDLVFW